VTFIRDNLVIYKAKRTEANVTNLEVK